MKLDWWTLGIQAVNVVILIWLLGRFFWRPMARMIAERRGAAERILSDAEAKRADVAQALEEIGQSRAGFAAERDAILAAARHEAEQARAARLADAEKEAASLQAAAAAAIIKERRAAEAAWSEQASQLAIDIAARLLSRLKSDRVQDAFLDRLVEELRALPEQTRLSLAANGAELEACSARALTTGEQQTVRARISQALGGEPQFSFRTDPALIAGLELHGSHLVVSNSWRADLDRIRKDLANDERR